MTIRRILYRFVGNKSPIQIGNLDYPLYVVPPVILALNLRKNPSPHLLARVAFEGNIGRQISAHNIKDHGAICKQPFKQKAESSLIR